jgi:lipopolysaccharide transport system ATP-binding protein
MEVVIAADIRVVDPALNLGFSLYDQSGNELLWTLTTDSSEEQWPKLERGLLEFRCTIPRRFLNEGRYRCELVVTLHWREWIVKPGENSPEIQFEIRGGLSDSPYWLEARPGSLAPEWPWRRTA